MGGMASGQPVKHAPPPDILGSTVIEVRDVWAVEDRVYCEVRTADGWIATCLLVDKDEWHVCHAYRRQNPSLWLMREPETRPGGSVAWKIVAA